MIVSKEITFTANSIDEVVLEVAEEIKKGFTIESIRPEDLDYYTQAHPKYTVRLRNNVGGSF